MTTETITEAKEQTAIEKLTKELDEANSKIRRVKYFIETLCDASLDGAQTIEDLLGRMDENFSYQMGKEKEGVANKLIQLRDEAYKHWIEKRTWKDSSSLDDIPF